MRYVLLLVVLACATSLAAQPSPVVFTPLDPVANGYFGHSVSSVPDADGDGHDDILIGEADDNIQGARRAYLYSGATGALLHTFDAPDPGLHFGYPATSVPDVDGDGRGDVLIGAADHLGGDIEFGRAYLFSGATGDLLRRFEPPDLSLNNDSFGYTAAGISDIDGDGRGDVLVGTSFVEFQPKYVYLFSGATGTLLHTLTDPGGGNSLFSFFGLDGVPDVDGDGLDDLLIPDYTADEAAGAAYIFSSADGTLLHTLVSPSPQNYSIFGGTAAGLPDLDGDGRGDVFVGALAEDGELQEEGRAYIYSGASGTLLHTLSSPTPEVMGWFGRSGTALPDIDGDAVPDLAIGAWYENERKGRVHLFSGASGAFLRTYDSPDTESEQGYFGVSVAGIRDPNGNAMLLVGATRENDTAGRAYLFTEVMPTGTEQGVELGDQLVLRAPSPNPTRGATTLSFSLSNPSEVQIDVFDLLGRPVAEVTRGRYEAGDHTVEWNGSKLSTGAYILRLETERRAVTQRVVLVR